MSYTDPERLPIEDLDAGLYIHRDDPGRRMPGIKVTTISDPDGMTQYLVDAVQFMEIQLERDNYRRALALINAWRLDPARDDRLLKKRLADAGFDDADGEAIRSLIASVRAGL